MERFAAGRAPLGAGGNLFCSWATCALVALLLVAAAPLSVAHDEQPSTGVENVFDCYDLRNALQGEEGPSVVQVMQSFKCDRTTWGPTVEVKRNVTVTGMGSSNVPAIDWSDSSRAVVAGEGVFVTFTHLVFVQEEMGVGGINLGFYKGMNASLGKFVGVVVGVASCPDSVQSFSRGVEHLPRPLSGEQKVTARGPDTLLVEDVGILWGENKGVWRMCNVVFECGVSSLLDSRLIDLFNDRAVQDSGVCSDEGIVFYIEGHEKQVPAPKKKGMGRYILIGGCILGITMALIVMVLCSRKKKQAQQKNVKKGLGLALEADRADPQNVPSLRSSVFTTWNINLSEVDVGAPLGRGGLGRVYKGCWQGTTVAVKIIKHSDRLLQTTFGEPFEAFLSKHISHPNVVQTYHISTKEKKSAGGRPKSIDEGKDDDETDFHNELFRSFGNDDAVDQVWSGNSTQYETWIVLEYCDLDSLQKALVEDAFAIKSPSQVSKMADVLQTALEIASAMNYLHSFRIIHGDLKSGNVLLKSDGSQPRGYICKVGDFGLSRFLAEDSHIETFTCGTITHMPPELLKGGVLSPAADVYSFGILLWELVTGESPYAGKNHGEIIVDVVNDHDRPQLPDFIPSQYSSLAMDCWQHDHLARPGFPEIIDRIRQMLSEFGHRGSQKLTSVNARGPRVESVEWAVPPQFTSGSMGDGSFRTSSLYCEMGGIRSPYNPQITEGGQASGSDGHHQQTRNSQDSLVGRSQNPQRNQGNERLRPPLSKDQPKSCSYHKKTSGTVSGSTEKGFVSPVLPAFTVEDTLFLSESEGPAKDNFVV